MTPRRSPAALAALGLTALALVAAAAPLGAQQPGRRQCTLGFRSPTGGTRTNAVKLPSERYNFFQGNGVIYFCEGQGNELRADSAEYYGDAGVLYMIGNVHYTEPRLTADARRMTYFQAEDRLLAEGDVVADMQGGTTMRGPRVEYWRTTPVRPRARLFAPGRPRMQLVERDSAGRPQEPVNVVANTIAMDGDSLVYAGGRVEITRPDLLAKGDSAFLDSGREYARLMRQPAIESRGDRPFTLVGGLIELWSRQRRLQRVFASREAVATSQDMRLASDTIDMRLDANRLQRAYAWGPARARVTSPDRDIVADSLDVLMPDQRLREVRALRGAYAATRPDTLRIRSTERDWLRGDTIIARFDSAATGDTTSRPRPRDVVASGNASSFYQIPAKAGPSSPPALNYVRGNAITVELDSATVQTVTVVGNASGVYLEPGADTSAVRQARDAATAAGASAAAGRRPPGPARSTPGRPATTRVRPPARTGRVPSPKTPASRPTPADSGRGTP